MKRSVNQNGKRLLIGVALSVSVYLVLAGVLALAAERGSVGESMTGACVALAAALSSLIGAKAASKGEAEPVRTDVLCAAAFTATVLLAGYLSNNELDLKRAAMLTVCALAGALCAALTGRGRGKKKRRSRR